MSKVLNIQDKLREREKNEDINRLALFLQRDVEDTKRLLKNLSEKYGTCNTENTTTVIRSRKDNDDER